MKGLNAIVGLALVLYLSRNIMGLQRASSFPNRWWYCSLWLTEGEPQFKYLSRSVKTHIGSLSLENYCELRGNSVLPRPRIVIGVLAPTAQNGVANVNVLLRSLLQDQRVCGMVLSRVYCERDLIPEILM